MWSWDITYLPTAVRGVYLYLYLVVDVWSRRIMGWAVHTEESSEHAARLIKAACAAAGVAPGELVLHADNGGPMRGATLLATLQQLGVMPSYSRPRVSDDNPYSEALFRTLKYVPWYPRGPFAEAEAARLWVEGFVRWYNREHLHSGIAHVTPDARHVGSDRVQLAQRREVYAAAKARTPARWSRHTRSWEPAAEVSLNARRPRSERSAATTAATPRRQGVDPLEPARGSGGSTSDGPRCGATREVRVNE